MLAAGRRKAVPGRRASSPRGRRVRNRLDNALLWLVNLAALALILVGIYAVRRPLLTGAGKLLTVRDDLHRADAIVLLSGDLDTRPQEAARLYHKGFAPRIVLAREKDPPSVQLGIWPGNTRGDLMVLQRLGVPSAAVLVLPFPGGTTSTYDEARAVREWAYSARPRSLIVVTSTFHTRRAHWLFHHQLGRLRVEILMDPVRGWQYDEHNWWQNEQGLIDYFEEYPKFIHEWLRD